ncbi:small ubiquitin-related modifier 3-like isoform X2 [Lytechinus variegatus]|uniref:small ubiquitin-related modifier 3-like isoform X2 n=1 Tax=Lytechinus variegatus TaxID=7654 RepID=UPI001BB2489E|nr:small ubiquitin-related modifier 3-like isoform X2 [Lytechinus variegatus]
MSRIRIRSKDGSTISFKIRRRTKLAKLMDAYRDKQGLRGQLRFRYDGQPVNEDDTPETLDMEDEDQLEAYQEQTGGRG